MPKFKLCDICEFITDGTHQTPKYCESGGYIFLSSKDVTSHRIDWANAKRIPGSLHDKLYSRLAPRKNDVLLAKNGTTGVAAIVDRDEIFDVYVSLAVLRPKAEILPEYLLYAINSPICKRQFDAGLKGVGVPNLHLNVIRETEISVPSYSQQIEICKKLRMVLNIIEQRNNQLKKMEDLIKARFVELFGDCRLNPKGWNTVALGDISEVGSSKRVFVEELKETGIPFYRGTEVGALAEGKMVIPELFIAEEHYDELIRATGKPELGDLLMPSICPDGRIWVVDTDKPFYFKDGRVLWVHKIDKKFDPVFLLYTLKDRIMTDYGSIASGTTFAELKIFALKQCQVFDVPIEDQRSFASFITQVDKSKVIGRALDFKPTYGYI